MSVSGEFQRYLTATLTLLADARGVEGDDGASAADLRRLQGELETAQLGPETTLAECARRAVSALENHDLSRTWKESCSLPAELLQATQTSTEELDSISRIVLGADPSNDR